MKVLTRENVLSALLNLAIATMGGVLAIYIYEYLKQLFTWVTPKLSLALACVAAVVIGIAALFIILKRRASPGRVRVVLWSLSFFLGVGCALAYFTIASPHAIIYVTQVPRIGAGPHDEDEIAGKVEGLGSSSAFLSYRVIIYAYAQTPSDRDPWYVQPDVAKSLTDIDKDGNWSSRIHLGSKYAAILVRGVPKLYSPPATLPRLPGPGQSLPGVATQAIVAVAITNGVASQ